MDGEAAEEVERVVHRRGGIGRLAVDAPAPDGRVAGRARRDVDDANDFAAYDLEEHRRDLSTSMWSPRGMAARGYGVTEARQSRGPRLRHGRPLTFSKAYTASGCRSRSTRSRRGTHSAAPAVGVRANARPSPSSRPQRVGASTRRGAFARSAENPARASGSCLDRPAGPSERDPEAPVARGQGCGASRDGEVEDSRDLGPGPHAPAEYGGAPRREPPGAAPGAAGRIRSRRARYGPSARATTARAPARRLQHVAPVRLESLADEEPGGTVLAEDLDVCPPAGVTAPENVTVEPYGAVVGSTASVSAPLAAAVGPAAAATSARRASGSHAGRTNGLLADSGMASGSHSGSVGNPRARVRPDVRKRKPSLRTSAGMTARRRPLRCGGWRRPRSRRAGATARGEGEAEAGAVARARLVRAAEALEGVREEVGREAGPLVVDVQLDGAVRGPPPLRTTGRLRGGGRCRPGSRAPAPAGLVADDLEPVRRGSTLVARRPPKRPATVSSSVEADASTRSASRPWSERARTSRSSARRTRRSVSSAAERSAARAPRAAAAAGARARARPSEARAASAARGSRPRRTAAPARALLQAPEHRVQRLAQPAISPRAAGWAARRARAREASASARIASTGRSAAAST